MKAPQTKGSLKDILPSLADGQKVRPVLGQNKTLVEAGKRSGLIIQIQASNDS